MRCCLIASVIVAGLAMPVLAQQTAESASHELLADAIGRANVRFALEGDAYAIFFGERKLTLHRLDEGKRLLVRASVKGNVSLQTLNAYNEKYAITSRAVQHAKAGVMLENGYDCANGVSSAGLAKMLTRFSKEAADF